MNPTIDVSKYGEGEEFVLPDEPQAPPVVSRTPARRFPQGKPRRKWLLTTGAFVLAMIGCAGGAPLCLTIVFFPIGAVLMAVACYPLHKLNEAHSKRLDAWYNRDRPLDEDTVKPWEL